MTQESGYFKHPMAIVESERVGPGTRVWAFAHVMEGAEIGAHCNICDHAFVESHVMIGNHVTIKNGVAVWDGVTLEDSVFVGPNVAFTNDKNPRAAVKKTREQFLPTLVREGASLGANSTIVCGVTIGCHAFVGAGAVVTKDVPDYGLVVGNPARLIGYICECGERIPATLACGCGKQYSRREGGLIQFGSGPGSSTRTPAGRVEKQNSF
jgi:UDP-2-acetamido-3-amino-2,3-dideoxy-glucuronate N-acetyltransferase